MTMFPDTPQTVAQQVLQIANNISNRMQNQWQNAYNLVWNHPNPDQVVAAMGTNAVKIFTLSANLATFMNANCGSSLATQIPTGWTFTANTDGSAVLTKTS